VFIPQATHSSPHAAA